MRVRNLISANRDHVGSLSHRFDEGKGRVGDEDRVLDPETLVVDDVFTLQKGADSCLGACQNGC